MQPLVFTPMGAFICPGGGHLEVALRTAWQLQNSRGRVPPRRDLSVEKRKKNLPSATYEINHV